MNSFPYQPVTFQRQEGNQLSMTLAARVRGAVGVVFDYVVAKDVLPNVLKECGLLPGAVSTSDNTDPWSVPGSKRTVRLADKSVALEQVTTYARPERIAYRTGRCTFPLQYLATGATGQWWFEPAGESTQLRWTYTFQSKNALAYPLLVLFARLRWAGYMRVCISNVQQHFVQIAPRSRFRSEARLSRRVPPAQELDHSSA